MTKGEKASKAVANSLAYKAKHTEYTGVDKRTYIPDQSLPSTAPNFKNSYQRLGHGLPSLIEIYRCDYYLSGKGVCYKKSVPQSARDRLLEELELEFIPRLQRFTTGADAVWSYFQEKYPEALAAERITSYSELVYRSHHRR